VEIRPDEFEALKQQVAALTRRVYLLEQKNPVAADTEAPGTPVPTAQQQPSKEVEAVAKQTIEPPPGTMLIPPPAKPSIAQPAAFSSPAQPAPAFKTPSISPAMRGTANMEEKIGQYWLNRVGIVAILIGVSYFLKYAFENNWIGPAGRIAIGLLAGIALILWSEVFRKRDYAAFSYSLKAVGIGTLYLSLWGAFQLYRLIPASAAFVAMVIVTAAVIAMALSQNAELLASFALVGGFATPMLLSTGENHEVTLFSYVCLLDIAILAMAVFQPWRRLLWGSFVGTLILYVAWSSAYYARPERGTTVFFSAIFAALFGIVPLILQRDENEDEARVPVILAVLPLLNATWFFLSLYIMYERETVTLTWYALTLAAVYLAIANLLRRRADETESTFVYLLHVAIAIAFLTIAIPVKLNAHWITIGWLIESAALLWVSVKTKVDFLRYLATATLLLGLARLLFFDQQVVDTVVFNSRFFTFLIAIAVLGGIAFYGKQHASEQEMVLINAAIIGASLLALMAITWEASDYFHRQLTGMGYKPQLYREVMLARGFTFSAIWLVYGVMLMTFGFWKRSPFARWQALILIALTTVKVFLVDISELGGSYRIVSFIALGAVLLAISFVYQRDWLKLSGHAGNKIR
jgi:uncharacterized membrane protein